MSAHDPMNARHGIQILESISAVPAAQWDALAGDNPFLSHAYLGALESGGCVGGDTGWTPCHLTLWRNAHLAAAMPLYLKTHSYGEYVFDWAWADAFQRHGLRYYPKLLSAIPFTPVTGPRLLAAGDADRLALIEAALDFASRSGVSSLHCLFPTQAEARAMADAGMLLRQTVQFHWQNAGYADFDGFLARMNHDKRKKIRQERRRLREMGLRFERLTGAAARESDWRFFYDCYRRTYRQHMSTPYLSFEFFLALARAMPENLVLVLAYEGERPVAAAFDVRSRDALYGRYWGTREFYPGLHFEACYYQAIEHCIEHGIARFEGGAQGEHKLARGLLPVATYSAHWIAQPEFRQAIAEHLRRETRGIDHYVHELSEHSPFVRGHAPEG
jgi:uncharacterized protein